MNEEKKLSDDELKDIAGGTKNYNSSKSNTSSVKKPDDVDRKARFEDAPKVKGK
jgi:hypothetical protein